MYLSDLKSLEENIQIIFALVKLQFENTNTKIYKDVQQGIYKKWNYENIYMWKKYINVNN